MSMSLELENIALKNEVQRLKEIVDYDELCKVYNKRSIQNKINNALLKKWEGVLLVIDIDRFKFINDYFGHLKGDDVLRKFSKAITLAVHEEEAIVGRVGGDEFIVFFRRSHGPAFIEKKIALIKEGIQSIQLSKENSPILSASIFPSIVQTGDTYEKLFHRADQNLIKYKRSRLRTTEDYRQLNEVSESNYYDLESFCLMKQKCGKIPYQLLIITIQPKNKSELLRINENGMIILYESIRINLRAGDFFTQYSDKQFLVLCKFVEENKLHFIKKRIDETFQKNSIGQQKIKISKFVQNSRV